MDNVEREAADFQTELFQLLAEFFGRATGFQAEEFATIDGFGDEIRSRATPLGHRGEDAFAWADEKLHAFYADKGPALFKVATRLGGLKLVMGGSSRFGNSQLAAVKGSLLYADTVLIPDPVFPWLETQRKEESFRHVLMLQAAHALLHLKPFIDADIPQLPLLVFPSFEKTLEDNDSQTKGGILNLLTDLLAFYLDQGITSSEDLLEFIRHHPDKFLESVERHHLFVAPGGPIGETLADAMRRYEEEVTTWRATAWLNDYHRLPIEGKLVNALHERMAPQYHLLENAEILQSHPLISVEQQGHYFKLISNLNSGRLERLGFLDPKTSALVSGLQSSRLAWTSHTTVEALVEIRQRNENVAFRKTLAAAISGLQEADIGNTDRVAAELCREINSGLTDHNRLIGEIDRKFADKRKKLFASAIVSTFGAMVPSLAPYLGAALPIGLAAKATWDALDQRSEKKRAAKSLMGVLAIAKSSG